MAKNKVDLFSHLNNINYEKDINFIINELKTYDAFMINRFMSMSKETLFFSEMMNTCHHLSKETQGIFYAYTVPKKKRFLKYPKKSKKEENLKYIMDYFNTSEAKAMDILSELTTEQVNIIKKKFDYGVKK